MEFNQLIRLKRKELNKTQQDIASECNISFQSVGKWERGDSLPTADKLPALSRALNVSVGLLITGKDDGASPLSSDFDTNKFCTFLASLRARCKLTQSEVAKQLYVNQSTVAKWENGKLLPDLNALKDLCVLYAVTPTELFSLKADMSTHVVTGTVIDAKTTRIWRSLKRWKTATALISCFLIAFIVLSTVMITQNTSLLDYKSKYEAQVAENKDAMAKYNDLLSRYEDMSSDYEDVAAKYEDVASKYEDVASKYEDLVKETNTIYTLTLIDDFAENKTTTSDIANNDYFTLSSPLKSGYVFKGWNTAADGSGEYLYGNIKITSDKTIYAIWQPIWLDERVYGESAAKISDLFLKIEAEFEKLFGYYEYFRTLFCSPYDEFSLFQQFDTASSIYKCFDKTTLYEDEEFNVRYYPLYICAYLSEAAEIAEGIPELAELADALIQAQSAAQKLSLYAYASYYYDDTQEWGDEYVSYVYKNYFDDYAPFIKIICDSMSYTGVKESPYDAFVKAYSVNS